MAREIAHPAQPGSGGAASRCRLRCLRLTAMATFVIIGLGMMLLVAHTNSVPGPGHQAALLLPECVTPHQLVDGSLYGACAQWASAPVAPATLHADGVIRPLRWRRPLDAVILGIHTSPPEHPPKQART